MIPESDKPSAPAGELLFPLLGLSRLRMGTDGAGVTTLVAGAGCPLSCRFCINKRLLAKKQPEWITPEELVARTKIDDLYFQSTGGGLSFGGGEALLHTDVIAAVRELTGGVWSFSAETSLNVSETLLQKAVGCVDAFIVDIKSMDPEIYFRYTGKTNEPVLENLRLLISSVPPEKIKIRVPLIPEYNTKEDRTLSVKRLKQMGFTNFDLFTYRVGEEERNTY